MTKFIEFIEKVGFKQASKNLWIKIKTLKCTKGVKSVITFKLKILKKSIKLNVSIENEHNLINNIPIYHVIIQKAVAYAHQFDAFITNQYNKLLDK